jgi:uncharacterized protein (TIGR00304 family)
MTTLGLSLISIGFIIALLAMLLIILRGSRGRVKGGGIILIGPIPIIFGTDRRLIWFMILAAIIIIIIALFAYLPLMAGGS